MRRSHSAQPASRRTAIAVAAALGLVSTTVAAASPPSAVEPADDPVPDEEIACDLVADEDVDPDDEKPRGADEPLAETPDADPAGDPASADVDGACAADHHDADTGETDTGDGDEHDPSEPPPVTTAPTTTAPSTTTPSTTTPSTTTPSTTTPSTTTPSTTTPSTTTPSTTTPSTTTPSTTTPSTTTPSTTAPSTSNPTTTTTPAVEPEPVEPEPVEVPAPEHPEVATADASTGADRLATSDGGPDPLEPPPVDVPPVAEEPEAPLPEPDTRWSGGTSRFDAPRGPGPSLPRPGRTPTADRIRPVDDIDVILATIRQLESGERYDIGPNLARASGAYQYIPSTWNGEAGYPEAYLAPPEVQDARARADVHRFLAMYGGDVSMVPVMWYYPRAAVDPSWMDRVPNPAGGNRLTIREYQERWLDLLARNAEAMLGVPADVADSPAAAAVLSEMPASATDGAHDADADEIDADHQLATESDEAGPAEEADISTDDISTDDPATGVGQGGDLPDDEDEPAPPPIEVDSVYVADETVELAARSIQPRPLEQHGLGSMRSIVFPVLGPATYEDGWGDSRDGGARRHEGTDIIGVKMQPLLAAVDGVVTHLRAEPTGISGVALSIQDADGWRYNYFHLNNDTPGTDDDVAEIGFRLVPGLEIGDEVVAGQVIGYMGDSGNAEESVPHLHFEFRDPDGRARPSYWSLKFAEARQACSVAIGPWATPNALPWDDDLDDDLDDDELDDDGHLAAARTDPDEEDGDDDEVWHTVVTPLFGEGEWVIDSHGRVTATGDAALIVPSRQLECDPGPSSPFGTDAGGWGDVTPDALSGTVWADLELTDTPLDGVIPPPPIDDETDEVESDGTDDSDPIDLEPLTVAGTEEDPDGDDPIARPLVFSDPTTGERIIVVFAPGPFDDAVPTGAI